STVYYKKQNESPHFAKFSAGIGEFGTKIGEIPHSNAPLPTNANLWEIWPNSWGGRKRYI
ncbi:MAG: hypothetical protein IJ530_10920, partial [Treponema sp.]|uniref:hypothetical protein n=1 Tax=Treponema sp. TaxID=166 RepID=UPI0025DDF13C